MPIRMPARTNRVAFASLQRRRSGMRVCPYRGSDRGRSRSCRGRYGARSLEVRDRCSHEDKAAVKQVQVVAGNIATAEGAQSADRFGCGRHQGRHRAWLDLHDAHCRRGRRAAADCDHGLRGCGQGDRHAGDRGWWYQVFGRFGQGDLCRCRLRHGWLAVGRHRRDTGRSIPLSGRSYKTYRGMGSVGAMARGSADRYFQRTSRTVSSWCRKASRGRCLTRGSRDRVASAHRRAAGRDGLRRRKKSRRTARQGGICSYLPGRVCGKAMCTMSRSRGKARTIRAVCSYLPPGRAKRAIPCQSDLSFCRYLWRCCSPSR